MKTIEEKAKAYDEAMNKIKPLYEQAKKDGNPIWSTYEYIIPQLCESEDERIRKAIVATIEQCHFLKPKNRDNMLAYLERQKEQKEELVYRLNGLMQEYINESKDEAEQEHRFKCYKLFWDALEDMSYFDEQKEQKPYEPQNFPAGKDAISQEQKQDYSGMSELERAIHRGFICAGVENVPVTIIKETAQECMAKIKPAEWSEGLEEEIDKWLYGCQIIERKNGRVYFPHKPSFSDCQNDWKNEGNAGGANLTADGLRDFARHFAEWGAEHLKK